MKYDHIKQTENTIFAKYLLAVEKKNHFKLFPPKIQYIHHGFPFNLYYCKVCFKMYAFIISRCEVFNEVVMIGFVLYVNLI